MNKKERTFWEILKRFTAPYFGNKAVTFKGTIFYAIWAVWGIFHIYFIEKIVKAIEDKDLEQFKWIMIMYSLAMIAYYLATYLSRMWWWVITINGFRKVIHKKYLDDYIKLSNTHTEKVWTGKLIAIVWNWMDTWSLLLDSVLNNSIKIIFTIAFTFYMISRVNLLTAIIFIIFYILIHIIWEIFNRKSLIHRRKRADSWNEYTWDVVKIIMSKFEILQTWRIQTEIDKADGTANDLMKHSRNMATPTHWFYYTPSIFINIVKILMFGFLWYQVILWNESLSLFVLLYWTLTLMNSVIISSMQFYSDLTNKFTKIEKMWDFFDNTPDIKGYESWKEFEYKTWAINIKKLTFWYTKKQKVFDNFSLDIVWWKVTALVGNSGSWKSTLVKLISWYLRQDSGKIKVDGQNLEKVSLKSYYKNIGYLTQEPSVFDGTIRDNLTYAVDGKLKKWELDTVITQAKCEFIYDLEDGIETEIGEKWIRLSWGQRQRLAIAKIFLKNPKIIILDEPTSALDSFSEEQITKAMHNLFENRTVIIIAHRLQTVKNADKILVLEDWKVVEEGNHKELVKQKWIYKKMLDLQSGF